ncbi:MAG TPA: prolyl oligopeptidase family serine peptidase [Alphaproteobacteria bacterium]|nr:prolyl oligopeptidase family serine peptidase [Alphaproteobacteria bacterium]
MADTPGKPLHYPPTRRDAVVDDYHGIPVADPYRWLEDLAAPETQDWIAAQNRLTRAYLDAIPNREHIQARLTALWNHPRCSVPYRAGSRYFFTKNDGLQNQDVLYMQQGLNGEPLAILDPNRFSDDGTVALISEAYSHDGTLLAYGLSQRGSDWQEIRIRHIDSGRDYEEVIRWCKFAGVAWKHDHSGFFYNRYPEPGSVPEADELAYNRLYWHALGTPQAADRLVYERPDAKELDFYPIISEDGQYLILHVSHAAVPQNRLYYREVNSDAPFVRLFDDGEAEYSFLGNRGATFYIHTDAEAPRGRIIAVDLAHPAREHWREIIPEQDDAIAFVEMVADHFAVVYKHDAQHRLKLYSPEGRFIRDIDLPAIGSIVGLFARNDGTELFIGFQSFLYPTTILRYDLSTQALTSFHQPAITFDPSPYETTQVFYPSKDGTRVPMFLTHKKGLSRDGQHPTLLYGYGGFAVSLTPFFAVSALHWIEQGGIFAVANLRGGSEYGEAWHRAGMLEHKQRVFDDFIAAAEWLIRERYTCAAKLAIMGRSNGGLLVAASLVQRPELFGAVICGVPVTDMLRYHRFTAGRFWVAEYGNAETDPEHFRFLYAYSPLHNVRRGVAYPPTLITTADTDDRVVPSHALKFAAALQAAQAGDHPILLRVDTDAGHGLGKPTAKLIAEQTDIYAFLANTVLSPIDPPPRR